MAFIATALLASCSDKGDDHSGDFGQIKVPDTRQLEQTVTADDTQAPQGVTFTTEGAWTSSIAETRAEAPSWITISPDHGDAAGSYTIKITLKPNPSEKARTAKIVITCGTSKIEITVTQEAGEEGQDPDERPSAKGLLTKITEYDDGKLESTAEIVYTQKDGPIGRIVSITVRDSNNPDPAESSYTFSYTGDSKMRFTETYTDKDTYSHVWDCQGTFSSDRPGGKILQSKLTTSDNVSTYTYEYRTGTDWLQRITSDHETTDTYSYEQNSCSKIGWESGGSQVYTYDFSNPDTDREQSADFKRLFQATPGINPALFFIDEPDMLRALGFYGEPDRYMPVKVVTSWAEVSVTQEFSYKYTIPADWGSETACMEITIVKKESGRTDSNTKKIVLSFMGIDY